jgi:acyl-CoA synthetase (AMP-forming)/AMP-acid ligase II
LTYLGDAIAGAAQRFGDRAAVVDADGHVVTYAELDARATDAATRLDREGVGEGTVYALTMPSNVGYLATYLGLAKLGAIAAGINPRLADPERDAILEHLQPGTIVDSPDRPSVIVFTSGTGGTPKGAVFGDAQLAAVCALDTGRDEPWDGGGPVIASTQFCHIGFMTKLPWYLRTGSTLLLQDRWRASTTLQLVERHRVRSLGGVAAQIALLLRVPDFDRYDVSSVETIIVGAGPSPPAVIRESRERFGAAYSVRYSSTESGGTGTGTAFDADDDEALHTVGRPRPGVEVRIDESSGQVQLRSPTVMSGYWRDPERTAATLVDGWLRTGDIGKIDDAGRLRLLGRTTDMYIRGGYNVHPQAVEAALADHPAIAQVAVVPTDDDVMGEVGVAVVVPVDAAQPPTLDELRAFASTRLAPYELPEAIAIVDALPLTTMDKLDRTALRTHLAHNLGSKSGLEPRQ